MKKLALTLIASLALSAVAFAEGNAPAGNEPAAAPAANEAPAANNEAPAEKPMKKEKKGKHHHKHGAKKEKTAGSEGNS